MYEQMGVQELYHWMVYDSKHPIDIGERIDVGFARVCALIVDIASAIYGGKGKNKPSKIEDFLPHWWGRKQEKKQQTVEEMKAILMQFVRK